MKRCCDDPIEIRHEGYDAYFCLICNVWLEKACSDEECEFCSNRPERPSQTEAYPWYSRFVLKKANMWSEKDEEVYRLRYPDWQEDDAYYDEPF